MLGGQPVQLGHNTSIPNREAVSKSGFFSPRPNRAAFSISSRSLASWVISQAALFSMLASTCSGSHLAASSSESSTRSYFSSEYS